MITYEQNNLCFNVRTIAIIFNGDKVLLQTVEGDGHWLLPGGRAELLEPAVDGIRREMREELEVEIEVERLVWVVENFFETAGKPIHQIAFYFLATLPSGCHLCEKTESFEHSEPSRTIIFQWVPLRELNEFILYPSFLCEGLKSLPDSTQYIVHRDTLWGQAPQSLAYTQS
jgi:ADP-ribose pyrophosphatase YjhB (NUDIX family)